MDAVSYSHADKQKQRIEKFIKQPDSTSGIVTVPDTIASGESIEIATGRQIVVDHLDVQGTLDIQGTLATVTGGYLSQTTMKTQAITHTNGTNAMTIDSSGNVMLGSNYLTPYTGFKNRIINGNFDVWQYGTGGTTNSAAFVFNGPDRFSFVNVEATNYVSSKVSSDGTEPFSSNYYLRITQALNSTTGTNISQKIENLKQFSNKTVTVSMWVKPDSAGKKIAIGLIYDFGTGETPSSPVYLAGTTKTLVAGWQKITQTFVISNVVSGYTYGTNSNDNLRVAIVTQSSATSLSEQIFYQSGTFDIAQVQLEEGSVATPFEQRPYGLELSLCQRYYEKIVFSATEPKPATYWTGNGGVFESVIQFNVEKRVIPTLSVTGIPQWSVNEGTWTNTSNPMYAASASVHSFNLRAGNASIMPQVAGAIRLNGNVVASAEL